MKCAVVLLLAGSAWMVLVHTHPATAEPVWGASCGTCHEGAAEGAVAVVGWDTVADPDESGTGAPDRGTRPVFRVVAGGQSTLRAEVADLMVDDTYAVALRRLQHTGVENGGVLTFAEDCDWAYWRTSGNHYTDPTVAHHWGEGPAVFEFDIGAMPDADADYYNLVFTLAGKRTDDGSLYQATEHFYLQVLSDELFSDGFETGDASRWGHTSGGGP